jgi:tetratricopeptide (TPR) repeat protein
LQRGQALLQSRELSDCETRSQQAALLHGLGELALNAGNRQEASALFQESLNLYRNLGDHRGEAQVLLSVAAVNRSLLELGDPKEQWQRTTVAQQAVLRSLAIFRDFQDLGNIANALQELGVVYLAHGEAVEAQAALEECISLCQNFGTAHRTYIEATGYLGVVYEYLGLYNSMRVQGQTTLTLAQEIGNAFSTHQGYYLIGCSALAQQQYEEAQKWLWNCVELNRVKGNRGSFAFSLVCLGLGSYKVGDKLQARRLFAEALLLANAIHTIRATVQGLLLGALLLVDQGKCALAVEVHALALCYPFVANSRWCEDVAGHELTAIAETLPTEIVAAARARGQASDLWLTAAALLHEIDYDGNNISA